MTTTLRSKIDVQLGWNWRDRIGPFTLIDDNRLSLSRELTDGAGAGQADVVWHAANQTIPAGQSITLELAALGQSIFDDVMIVSLARVKAILVINRSTAANACLVLGGAGVGEWFAPFGMLGDTVKVMPESPLLLAHARDGWEVEPGYEALKLQALGGDVTFDIAILAVCADGSPSPSSSDPGTPSGT